MLNANYDFKQLFYLLSQLPIFMCFIKLIIIEFLTTHSLSYFPHSNHSLDSIVPVITF